MYTAVHAVQYPLFLCKIESRYAEMADRLLSKNSEWGIFIAPPGKDGQCWLFSEDGEDAPSKREQLKRLKKSGLID